MRQIELPHKLADHGKRRRYYVHKLMRDAGVSVAEILALAARNVRTSHPDTCCGTALLEDDGLVPQCVEPYSLVPQRW